MEFTSSRRRSLALGLGLAAGTVVLIGRARRKRVTTDRVERLLSVAERPRDRAFRFDDVVDLPDPVRWYFEAVVDDGRPHVRSARLQQRGEFRLGGRTASWKPTVRSPIGARR
jgi:hypothetical protein